MAVTESYQQPASVDRLFITLADGSKQRYSVETVRPEQNTVGVAMSNAALSALGVNPDEVQTVTLQVSGWVTMTLRLQRDNQPTPVDERAAADRALANLARAERSPVDDTPARVSVRTGAPA